MNTNHREPPDDLEPLFAATADDAPPPDRAALAALRERAAAEFAQRGPAVSAGHGLPGNANRQAMPDGDHRTTLFPLRVLIALAATAAVLMAGFFLSRLALQGPPPVAELTFGDVMQNLATLQSYQAEVIGGDGERQLVVGRGDTYRVEASPTVYTIVTPREWFLIDEEQNQATSHEWADEATQLNHADPLRIVELSCPAISGLMPTERRTVNGRNFLVYDAELPNPHDGSRIEMLVDPQTELPAFITATNDRGQRPSQNLHFVSFNQPLDESKLKVAATLTEDGRIGKVTAWQGNVALRPLTSTRWTPVCGDALLRPGDWLRTDFQGANAVTVQLAPQTNLILGPGSLVEFKKPDQITLHSGFAEITPSPKTDNFSGIVKLTGPNGSTLDVGGIVLIRANDKGLVTNDKPPAWLAGYKGTAVSESLGSLLALIDGRRVPLTVGYHKVSVEIRDQIARTTIEESFVNHTGGVLEGQFHFPLPADASISGFGMWIGDRLVEADIVEKQRAREIYETILREKRDPGLLEWTGGNIFKARVYPIPAHGEKRIKIVYTQVLPRKGERYRYSYALQSDLLRQNPLRQLDLEVTIHSTLPLGAVTCPTHQTRDQLAEHAARVEFSAQNYTPTRDFEVVVETASVSGAAGAAAAAAGPEVVFIPHQRGEDGYFLLQLEPPGEAGPWKRDVLPDDRPLDLLVLADTSASMDAASRKTQAEVLAALLGSLSPKDTFNVAMCDVDCTWVFDEPQQAEEKSIASAREKLATRRSLGWTNLDRAFASVAEKVKQGTQVVYLGDGVVTTGDMDGPAFVQRLTRLVGGKGATLHAVAVSSSYDAAVLRGMAAIGGGSLRSVSGEVGPQQTAKDLLAEITQPALKNIELTFSGLRTARVYPRVLRNLPLGTQQIVLGRYQPLTTEQSGEVIVTGTLNGQPVTYRTGFRVQGSGFRRRVVSTPDSRPPTADSDASFIPRLWARLHLDELLAQGTSQEIQDEIINLSEEFHLMTPYTSLLVLETEADRERFKVKRRFQMSDGERFFADARDTAQYQLVQQQMQRAGLWRLGLRQSVLDSLSGLGRDQAEIDAIRQDVQFNGLIDSISSTIAPETWYDVGGPGLLRGYSSSLSLVTEFAGGGETIVTFGGTSGDFGVPARHDGELPGVHSYFMSMGDQHDFIKLGAMPPLPLVYDPSPDRPHSPAPMEQMARIVDRQYAGRATNGKMFDFEMYKAEAFEGKALWAYDVDSDGTDIYLGKRLQTRGRFRESERRLKKSILFRDELRRSLPALFPIYLGPAPAAPSPPKARLSVWSAEAQRIAGLVKHKIDLAKLDGALVIDEQHDSYEEHRGRIDARASSWRMVSAEAWLANETSDSSGPTIEWAAGKERGILSVPYELALVRKSAPTDFPKEYQAGEWWQANLTQLYHDRLVRVEKPKEDHSLLILIEPLRPDHESRILIDEARGVALSIEHFQFGQPQGGSRASDFVQIAGVWLAQKVEHFDEQGRNNNVITRKFENVGKDQIATLMAEKLTPRDKALSLNWPLPKLPDAKDRAAKGQAATEDRLRILIDLAADQKWPEATEELARCEQLLGEKYFRVWLRLWLLQSSRRNEELKQHVLTHAQQLADQPRAGEFVLASHLYRVAGDALSSQELLTVLDLLKSVYARLPEHLQGPRLWGEARRNTLQNAGRTDDEIALLRELVRDYPDDSGNIRILANRLAGQGDHAAAFEALKAALERPGANWPPSDRDQLYETWAELLENQGRYADQAALVAGWLKLAPTDSDAYERYLAALLYTRQETVADQLVAEWLDAGLTPEPMDKALIARTEAAIETAMGDNSYVSGGDLDPRFVAALAKLVEHHADREDGQDLVSNISGDSDVRSREEFRLLGQRLLARLKENAGNYAPARLERLAEWVMAYAEDVSDDDWKAIAAAIRPQWENASHRVIRESYAETLLDIYSRIGDDEKLAFLRERLAKADEEDRPAHARRLFDALLEAAWTAEIETESLGLIDKLSASESDAGRLRDWIAALYRWTDRMNEARYARLHGGIERPDKLTSTELETKRTEIRQQVRTDLSARLKAAAGPRQDELKKWLLAEHLYLEVRQERELARTVEAIWELLGPAPPAAKPVPEGHAPAIADELNAAFRARLVTMLIGLATRRDAPAAEIDRLHKYLDAVIAASDAAGPAALALDGRMAKYVLLVALDKPQPLAEQLAAWSKGTDRPEFWQQTLAYVKAELGQLEEAIALLQPLAASDSLEAADYQMLAAWHQALKHDAEHAAMQVAAWKQLEEWQLRDFVRMHLRPWENREGPSPGAIDPQVFLVLKALFEKARDPGEHVYYVRDFYEKSRDFRLLAALADAVVGQSSGSIYRFLKECESTLDVIDREATANELLAHLSKVRERVKTPVDQRALDLLEMLVERRSAELQNQPDPHVAAAVAALKRATKPEYSPGEPRLFAQLLADLGGITQEPLSAERVRVIRTLHDAVQGMPQDRLPVAQALAESLRNDDHRQQAIDALEPALAEHLAAAGGRRTAAALDSVSLLADLYSATGQFVRAEQVVRRELPRAANPSVAFDLTIRLYGVHISALQQAGTTSLGKDERLYAAARDELIAAALKTPDQRHRRRLVEQLCRLFRTAKDHTQIGSAGDDAAAFGRVPFAVLIDRQIDEHQDLVQELAGAIRHTAGPREAMEFYLTRIENEPSWLVRKGQDGWRQFAWQVADLTDDEPLQGKLGELEPRLLAIVLKELRRELVTQNYRQRVFYHDGYSHFWREKTADFARVAEEVLASQRDSLRATLYIADYLYHGVDQFDRAIAVLFDARRRGLLDEDGSSRLVAWLQEQKRFGESIALLESLVDQEPDQLRYRIQLMHAYFQTKQPEALAKLLAETDKFFHEEDRWNGQIAGELAASCLENLLLERAVEYLKEAIERREESLDQQTTGDRTLAQYYVERAYAYAGLKNTDKAVEDAAAAIVIWGAAGDGIYRRNVRTGAVEGQVHPIDLLKEVLVLAPDLDAYVAQLDKHVAEKNEDRPILRKAIGDLYFERKAFDKALVQLKVAAELAPQDGSIHARLVECYDALMMPREAAEQLFASVELARRDIDLWVKLSERLEKLEQPAEAERARTSLVEMLPTEAEGHARLAEIRQSQDRWSEAADHWRHVARLRKLEPAGLLGLAAAQIRDQQRAAAEGTIKELETTDWPARFQDELRQKHLPQLREQLQKLP